jgi:hypothetical protein
MISTIIHLALVAAVAIPQGTPPRPDLTERKLDRDTTIAGHRFTSPTWIYLDASGAMRRAWLQRDTELQGHVCKGTGYKGWSLDFHENGALAMCYLAGDQEVEGVPCRGGSFWGDVTVGVKTLYHENGRLQSCVLTKKFEKAGVTFSRNARIEFDAAGLLVPGQKK